jgi:hypothetical protein
MPLWEIFHHEHGELYLRTPQRGTSRAVGACQVACYAGVAATAKRGKTAPNSYVKENLFQKLCVAEEAQSCSRSLTGPEKLVSKTGQPSTGTGTSSQSKESELPIRWPSSSLSLPHIPNTTTTQSEESLEYPFQYEQLSPFSYDLNSTATKAEVTGALTTSSAFDIPLFPVPLAPSAPYIACSGADGMLGAWVDTDDPIFLDEGLDAFYYTPPIDFFTESYDISDTSFALGCEPTYVSRNDLLAAENGKEPDLIPQPDILYPMFLSGSTREDADWLSPRLYERVVEMTSHCKPAFSFKIISCT